MSQQQPQLQQMDYAEMSRKFPGMIFNHNPYSLAQKVVVPPPQQTQMYPMNGMAPNLIPIPMMPTMQMSAPDMDYNRWMTDSYQGAHQQIYCGPQYDMSQQPMQQMAMSQPQGMSRMSSHGSMGRISTSRSPTPSVDMCSSPRFGPGPPIVTSERVKGPRGCNLFVFHLPNEITNWDLYLLFRRFGTILSVHTMVNKSTGLSKGFGFVSYSAHQEAHAAITEMDGFRLGKKRLKVQLKRSQDDNDDEDDGSDVFYPGNLQQQQQQQQQQYGDIDHQANGPTRTGSYGSFYGDSTSGQTTRASTPTGGSRGRGDFTAGGGGLHRTVSGDANDANGYFHGVNSANHSPAEEGATAQELSDQMGKLSVVEGGGCVDAPAEVVTAEHTAIPPPPSVPASKTKTPFAATKPHAAAAPAAGGNGGGAAATATAATDGNNRKK